MEFQLRESSPIPIPPPTTQFIKQKLLEKTERVCVCFGGHHMEH